MRKEFGKLVRDRIPEIIEGKGEQAFVRILEGPEFREALLQKLVEEAEEARSAGTSEDLLAELADLLEVARALCEEHGLSLAQVEQARVKKKQERGGFEKRTYLEATE